jgi:hypothetical protein
MGRKCLRFGLYKKENALVGERERERDKVTQFNLEFQCA